MKIIINAANKTQGGGKQVAISVIEELAVLESCDEFHVLLNSDFLTDIDTASFPANFTFYLIERKSIELLKIRSRAKELSLLEKEIAPDRVITVFGPAYWRPKGPHTIGFALGLYALPESPYFKFLTFSEKVLFSLRKVIQLYFFRKDADIVITETEVITQRVKKLLGKNSVYTVSNNCSSNFWNFRENNYKKVIGKKVGTEIRLLSVTGYYRHKNLEIIPAVLDNLSKIGINNVKFILTLKKEHYIRIIPEKYRSKVQNIGYIESHRCPNLYYESDIVFLPTLAECFSASYPEAMIMGKPIVTTDLSFAHSLCGEAALYYNALDALDAATKIKLLIENKSIADNIVSNGFKQLKKFDTPKQRVEKILKISKNNI
ncbi:MAG: glycosyltransferase [Acinetobacter sp.]